jgi:macrolide transport system ATP-binding/permease protein
MRIFDSLLQDVRFALRTMAVQPFFSVTAVLSLALGIGTNTAIYSFLDSILMRALPVLDPESLMVLTWHSKAHPAVARRFSGSTYTLPKTGYTSPNFPYPAFELVRERNEVFSSLFAFSNAGRLNVQVQGQADVAQGQYVSGEFFPGLGVLPAAGRLLATSDDRVGGPMSAVLSYGYAQRRFADAARAVGETILINGSPFAVAGVAAPEFFGVDPGGAQDIYLPMQTSRILELQFSNEVNKRYAEANFYWVQMMGRLRPGVTMAQAQVHLAPLFHNFVAETAVNDKERTDMPELLLQEGAGGLDSLRRQYSKSLYVLMTMVGLILAIACANMANLLLARAAGRRREIGLRLSLGAGRWRVIRQLLTESVLLACLGGLIGVALAKWGIRALTLLIANGRENFTLHATLNWHVLAVTFGLSVLTGVLFGLAPALQSTNVDLISALKQTKAGERRFRIRGPLRVSLGQVLAVGQIAMSLLLLAAAALFVRTLNNLNSIAVGFNRDNLLLVSLNARQAGYKDDALMRFYHDLQSRLAGLPGVRKASVSNYAMLSQSWNTTTFRIPGKPSPGLSLTVLSVGPGYLGTMQIPVLLGRDLDDRDFRSSGGAAVVNELFAKKWFTAENPVGRHFLIKGAKDETDFEIVGVAKTTPFQSLKEDVPPVAYVIYNHNPGQVVGQMLFTLRTATDPLALATAVRQAVRKADSRIPVSSFSTEARQIEQTIWQERTFATLCTSFALLAVAIAGVGLYGIMAYSVARRTNEIGIRMALGARRSTLVGMVLREVFGMTAVGLAIGLAATLATTRFLESFLFRMKPNDPIALAVAGAFLLIAALAAGYAPARRASRIDPWIALRDE